MKNENNNFIRLAKQLEDLQVSIVDLWTLLPSYRQAKLYHGDSAMEHQPFVSEVMKEAASYIADLLDTIDFKIREDKPKHNPLYDCPCGKKHNVKNDIVCPTCKGEGIIESGGTYVGCPSCKDTGRNIK